MNSRDNNFDWYKHISDPVRSLVREELLNHKLFYDLKLAALQKGSYLKIYPPTVDVQGYDVFIEDGMDYSRKFQLKSKMGEKTSKWSIHQNMIVPGFSEMEDYGFNARLCPSSAPGFIVIIAKENEAEKAIETSYLYTDINILTLIALGYIKRPANIVVKAANIYKTLQDPGRIKERIEISPSLMVKIKDASSLLKVTGFLSDYDFIYAAKRLNRARFARTRYFGLMVDKDDPAYYDKLTLEVETEIRRNSKIISDLLQKFSE